MVVGPHNRSKKAARLTERAGLLPLDLSNIEQNGCCRMSWIEISEYLNTEIGARGDVVARRLCGYP
jgi:hypothetical protein